jgi:hypothetical protein
MNDSDLHDWLVWYPKATATGMLVARGRIDPTDRLLFHAAPDVVTVEVFDGRGKLVARAEDLEETADSPICLLTLDGNVVRRQDLWPSDEHIGLPVLLPGGEAGILQSWWNSDDRMEWRWQVEFYNSRR